MGQRPLVVRTSYSGVREVLRPVADRLAAGQGVVVALGPPGDVDLALLDGLARLALAARRGRGDLLLRLDGPGGTAVRDLARLCGLGAVLPLSRRSGQVGGEPEPEEQGVAEEVVEVGDPPA